MKITILLHKNDPYPEKRNRMLWVIVSFWKKKGFEIEILKGIPKHKVQVDLLIPHIDLTRVPSNYIKYIDQFPNVLNRHITDISKRKISKNLLTRNDEYNSPIIIKTNLNYGGIPELKMRRLHKIKNRLERIRMSVRNKNSNYMGSYHFGTYPVFEHASQVPPAVWKNRNLVVEKFIPERQGEYYSIRVCLFLGDVVRNSRVFSLFPIVKGSKSFAERAELPDYIIQYRENNGLDFGKIDYVMHNGKIHILDVNKTPGVANNPATNLEIGELLAEGIYKYVDRKTLPQVPWKSQ